MKLSELYSSIQCEGPNTGEPTQFLRFGGCNLRCPGWPCDTEFAVDPKFRDEWASKTAEAIYDMVPAYPKRICITGGEPLIQPKEQLSDLVRMLIHEGEHSIDLFTNGTRPLPSWALWDEVSVVMDWKLPSSGEGDEGIPQRLTNILFLQPKDAVKFVVKDWEDVRIAHEVYTSHRAHTSCEWYIGKVWGAGIQDEDLITYILNHKLPWRLNVQFHKHIWAPDKRGV